MKIQNSKIKDQNKSQCLSFKSQLFFYFKIGIYFGFWVLIFGFCTGCSRTVTPIVTYGEQMIVEVTLRGNVDTSANCYFMVFGSDQNYKIPLPWPNQIDAAPEMLEPGTVPLVGSIEAYYSNFYNSWSGYVLLEPAGYTLVKGPFVLNQVSTREFLSPLGAVSSKLNFEFRLGRLFTTIPDKIYFDVVSVPWTGGGARIPKDHLPSTNNYISKVTGSIIEVPEFEETSVEASLDILKVRVEIQ